MSSSKLPEDDPSTVFLVRKMGAMGSPSGTCPDTNLLAGFTNGGLLPDEREKVQHHLSRCAQCRAIVADLAREDLLREQRFMRSRRVWVRPLAVAALLVVSVTVVVLGWGLVGPVLRTVWPARPGTDELLIAAARDLTQVRPDLFGNFAPLNRQERLAPSLARRRSGLEPVPIYPAGLILEARPTFRWEASSLPGRYEINLLTEDRRKSLWSAQVDTGTPEGVLEMKLGPDSADLQPAIGYVWRISADGPLGEAAAERPFRVASAVERAAFEGGLREIETRAPEKVRLLLKAHYAIRQRLYGEAVRLARSYVAANPEDSVGRETLVHVLGHLGSSEGGRLREDIYK